MAIVIINHKVKDFKTWKPYFDADRQRRTEAGIKDIYVATSASDPNDVHLVFETDNVAEAQHMMENQDLRKIMDEAGVISQPNVTILNKA